MDLIEDLVFKRPSPSPSPSPWHASLSPSPSPQEASPSPSPSPPKLDSSPSPDSSTTSLAQNDCSSSAILLDWHADCSHRSPITIDSSRRVKGQLRHSQDPSEILLEGVFCCRPPSMEPPANRTQANAFHAGFQAFLKTFLFHIAYYT